MQDKWDREKLTQLRCTFLLDCINTGKFDERDSFPSASELTKTAQSQTPSFPCTFIPQIEGEGTLDYYEIQIANAQQIPTRENNWHDFFNGLIWHQFPKSKMLISRLHAKDIEQHGLSPRTPRRDRLTHFDECGLLLLVKKSDLAQCTSFFHGLSTHNWTQVYLELRNLWHNVVTPCLFGHASAEMMLSPFVGLTAKWVLVPVDDDFDTCSFAEKRAHVDDQLLSVITYFDGFTSKNVLRPIPLLGIPQWCDKQNANFYSDSNYFRSQREGVALTQQYPPRWPLKQ
ncbi:DUF3025 domain-containing protein [Alteromonas sp. 5E99-2]|uniref:DUF3025 domain-containing protein n=1 Tax=Alteromonas sp. 5E99-2 TaxID=2817683 RepID=UPI001A9911DF|nr:DUF3025 domain-containing protein [Alteromonas sp. 5E99-2]